MGRRLRVGTVLFKMLVPPGQYVKSDTPIASYFNQDDRWVEVSVKVVCKKKEPR